MGQQHEASASAVTALPRPASRNAETLRRADSVLAGGTLGTLRLGEGLERVVASASGSRLTDVDGAEYIDYILGAGPLILGHSHPAVTRAVQEQVERGSTYYLLNEPAIELAELIVSALPSDSRIRFTSSGSEATFYSMRLARAFTGRDVIVKFAGAYHGHNDYSMLAAFAGPWTPDQKPVAASAGVPNPISELVEIARFNDRDSVESIFDRRGGEIAALIVEPFQRVLEPKDGFLQFLRDITTQHGALLVADEVVTGFRFHFGFAHALYGVTPDLTAAGKIIAGGFPLAAVAGRQDIMELANVDHSTDPHYAYVSGTLSGYAVGAAAGLATLRCLQEPGSYERLHSVGDRLRRSLQEILTGAGYQAQVLGRGPMFHAVFASGDLVSADDLATADWQLTRTLYRNMIRRGVMMNPAQRAYVSLAHTDADLAQTIAVFEEAVATLRASGAS